jgi:antitoxin (DNA-binding transcriptional repressor) of toxin-antitoxin stability system
MKVDVRDFPWRFKEFVPRSERGEEAIILRAGKPVLKLEPLTRAEHRKLAARRVKRERLRWGGRARG